MQDQPALFVFTASNSKAQQNIERSIENPIDSELLHRHLDSDVLDRCLEDSETGELYAWGATPGEGNEQTWSQLSPGDYVLAYADGSYRYWSEIIYTLRNRDLAEALWGRDDNGGTWEFMFFLQRPRSIDVRLEYVQDIIDVEKYYGFTPVGQSHLERIREQYESIQYFIEERLDEPADASDSSVSTHLQRLVTLLRKEKQIIFAGPPGTSKTYDAFAILAALASRYHPDGHPAQLVAKHRFSGASEPDTGGVVWDIVQFHQSYGYEDFVSGIDTEVVGAEDERKHLTFDRQKRIFLEMVESARQKSVPHVLIIDEINRGNLGRIFGELILTLEYRDLPVRLPGQDETVKIPSNLYLIGTMNTADRNISLVDHALRRRFQFVEYLPNRKRLANYFDDANADLKDMAMEAFEAVQKAFKKEDGKYRDDPRGYSLKDYAVGHTYFMVESIEELSRRLSHQVIPLLDEYQKEGILTSERLRPVAKKLSHLIASSSRISDHSISNARQWCNRQS